MNYSLSIYKGKNAIFCNTSKCFVLFGKKTELKKRLQELNEIKKVNLYLVNCFNSKNAKKHFISEVVEATNESEVYNLLINKKYYFDFEQKRPLATCKKIEILHKIN